MRNAWKLLAVRLGFAVLGRVWPWLAAWLALRLFSSPRRHPRPPREAEALASGTPLRLGPDLAATAWGEGPVVLLIHGWEGRGSQLGAFAAPLAAAGHRVIALDGPAHGDSPGERTNAVLFAEALRAVDREIGPFAAIVAHSFGAATSTLALTRGLRAGRMVAIASPSALSKVVRRFHEMIGLPKRARRRFHDLLKRRAGVSVEELDIARLSSRLTIPALVFHDPDDAEVPFTEGRAIAAAWPGARLRVVPGAGHRRILRAPEVIAETVAFVMGERAVAEIEEPAAAARA